MTRVGLAMTDSTSERHTYLYLVRFIAFALILIAIIDKNRPKRSTAPPSAADDSAIGSPKSST
jgi:hypothetical protein